MTRVLISLSLLTLIACGGSTPVADMASDVAANACPAVDAPCMNEANHAQCLQMSQECPGEVSQLESCPLQFACNGSTAPLTDAAADVATDVAADTKAYQCPAVDAPCMNEGNYAQCIQVSQECPGEVTQLESCPLQFACQ